MVAIYQDEVNKVKDAPGIVPSLVLQPISTDMTKFMTKNGGNPLGLAGQGPLNCMFFFSIHLATMSDRGTDQAQ
jgi:hypothetical protein